MQKSNKYPVNCVFIAVPADLLEEVGIEELTEVQMWASQGRLIMEPVDEVEADILDIGYDSVEDFLENLSPRKQYDALCFLTTLQAIREEAKEMHEWVAENE